MIKRLVLFAAFVGCGLPPLKPLVPLGCKDLVLKCQCDRYGQNCIWVWECVVPTR